MMGVAEIAARLGVSRSRAAQIVRERTFPEPVARLTGMDIWLTDDVERWIREHRTTEGPTAPTA